MLENLLEALKEMRDECQSRPSSKNACIGCPYEEFCEKRGLVFSDLPQDFEHPLLDD